MQLSIFGVQASILSVEEDKYSVKHSDFSH